MATTIQVSDTTKQMLNMLKEKKQAKTHDMVIQQLAQAEMTAFLEVADKFERENRRFDVCRTFMQRRAAVLPLTVEIALAAAKLKKKQREKKDKFSIYDGIHLATAMQENSVLVTADFNFAGLENVMVV